MMRTPRWAVLCAAALAVAYTASQATAAPLFTDDFNNGVLSLSKYSLVSSDPTSSSATYQYDYSANGIPPAPSTADGSTLGVKLHANLAAPNAVEGVTLHTLQNFAGDYYVRFDAWMNVNGPFPAGGNGSTQYFTAGVGGDLLGNNIPASSAANPAVSGVGGWFAVNGENGNGNDYRWYKGTASQAPATGQYAAGTGSDARNGETHPHYAGLGGVVVDSLPVQGGVGNQTGTTYDGAFGMKWQQVELRVDADGGTGGAPSMDWYVSGKRIGTLDAGANGAFTTAGSVTIGYADPTQNLSDAPQYSFAVVDNLRVIVPEPGSMSLVGIAAAMLVVRRRRT